MATSGTTVWALQRDAIINSALRKLAVLSGGSTPETYQVTQAAEALNALIKGFQADGMPLWEIKNYTFTPSVGVGSYNIGIGQTLDTAMPLKVIQAWRNTSTAGNIPMQVITSYNFNLLPGTSASAIPVSLYYQPFSTFGQINIWPKPADTTNTITLEYQSPFEDMNASTDDLDFPSYWTEAIIYTLASRLAPEYGLPLPDRQLLAQEAMAIKQAALSYGSEEGSIFLQTNWTGRS